MSTDFLLLVCNLKHQEIYFISWDKTLFVFSCGSPQPIGRSYGGASGRYGHLCISSQNGKQILRIIGRWSPEPFPQQIDDYILTHQVIILVGLPLFVYSRHKPCSRVNENINVLSATLSECSILLVPCKGHNKQKTIGMHLQLFHIGPYRYAVRSKKTFHTSLRQKVALLRPDSYDFYKTRTIGPRGYIKRKLVYNNCERFLASKDSSLKRCLCI